MFPHLETNDEYEEALTQLLERTKPAPVPGEGQPLVVVADDQNANQAGDGPADAGLSEEQLREELWGYGNAMLREIATPTVSPTVRKAYTTVLQHTKAKGFKFPALPGSDVSSEADSLS